MASGMEGIGRDSLEGRRREDVGDEEKRKGRREDGVRDDREGTKVMTCRKELEGASEALDWECRDWGGNDRDEGERRKCTRAGKRLELSYG